MIKKRKLRFYLDRRGFKLMLIGLVIIPKIVASHETIFRSSFPLVWLCKPSSRCAATNHVARVHTRLLAQAYRPAVANSIRFDLVCNNLCFRDAIVCRVFRMHKRRNERTC